eukprot:scaffold17260_cov86-Cyclotella_meneghiniana.AAC.1
MPMVTLQSSSKNTLYQLRSHDNDKALLLAEAKIIQNEPIVDGEWIHKKKEMPRQIANCLIQVGHG